MKRTLTSLICLLICLMLPFAFAAAEGSEETAYQRAGYLEENGELEEALELFTDLGPYKDSILRAEAVSEKLYERALMLEEAGYLEEALAAFQKLGSFSDSETCAIRVTQSIKAGEYAAAEELENSGLLEEAEQAFLALGIYKDSAARAEAVREKIHARAYAAAEELENAGKLEEAEEAFLALGNYSDSAARAEAVREKILEREYLKAEAFAAANDPVSAYEAFAALIPYKDSAARAEVLKKPRDYAIALKAAMNGDYASALSGFTALGDYEDSADKAYALGVSRFAQLENRGGGIAAFEFHEAWGFLNLQTNTVVSPRYESIAAFDGNGLAVAKLEGRLGLIDTEGRVILPCEYAGIEAFQNGFAIVEKNEKFGCVNTLGETVIPCEWAAVSEFYNGLCTVAKTVTGNKNTAFLFGIYKQDGTPLTEATWRTLGGSGNADTNTGSDGAYYAVPWFENGLMKAQTADGLWGFMKPDGTMAAEPVYKELREFTGGLCAAKKGDLWGFIDRSGETAVQFLYSEVKDFTAYGFAEVLLPGAGWQVIDANGSLLYFINEQFKYDYETASGLMAEERYGEAYALFITLEGYADSNALAAECYEKMHEAEYAAAGETFATGRYEEALTAYEALGDYKDSARKAEECREGMKEQTYQQALGLMNEEKYEEALALFDTLPGYKNVDQLLTENEGLVKASWTSGHYVFFGAYEQDNDASNGKEPIEWLVLDKQDNTVMLISRYGLDCKPYNTKRANVTWEKSTLRKWLNEDFFKAAFSAEEQKKITVTQVSADKNPSYSTDPGRETKDKLFLLSIQEANKYFEEKSDRVCMPTPYAKAQGAYEDGSGAGWWWLRSPGSTQSNAADVSDVGNVSNDGGSVNMTSGCVRPVVCVRL